jgi:tRNA pseudouridine38-40 synthase
MRNVRVELAYDGSKFFGWQRQDGFRSVQAALEEALNGLLGEVVCVHGAGRTDTGVHALRQVAHFHVDTRLDDDRLRHAIQAHLDRTVVVNRLETCRDDFHARFDARAKRYVYFVRTSRFRPPFGTAYTHWVNQPLDLAEMRRGARAFLGRHDFRAFGNTGSERKTTVRTISHSRLVARRDCLAYVVEGEGFLYNMVRTMAGTLLDVGRGKVDSGAIERALASGDREDAGPTAPPEGLYLARVLYPEPTFLGRDRGPRGVPGLFQY